jgi:nicotinate dehydrogenase FAD-subunit
MERFSYLRPRDVQEAVNLLQETPVRNFILAGGTDLMLIIRQEKTLSGRLIDISMLPELHEITRQGDVVTVGAASTFNEVQNSPVIRETAPVLAQAARQVGATQIRNMGTIGGNVANAAACADSIPALVCLDAVAHIRTATGEQEIPVVDLVTGPNKTILPQGGLITCFRYHLPPAGSRGVFLKLGRRNAMAISRLTVAALGSLTEDGIIAEARYVTGSATPRISRLKAVEHCLIGNKLTPDLLHQAAQIAVAEMIRLAGKRWSSEFKMPALASMTMQAFAEVFQMEMSRQVAP